MSKIVQNCVTLFMDDPYHKIDIKILIILEKSIDVNVITKREKKPSTSFQNK